MRLYLAAQFSRRDELRNYGDELQKIGIDITSGWVYEPSSGEAMGDNAAHTRQIADRDIRDIDRCNWLLLFTNGPETRIVRGAHHFEAGYAYGRGIRVITVGPRDNVFHYLPCIRNFPTWEDAFEYLKRERAFEEAEAGY
jgi:nucleoside 2-deoxyribosyltransferase